MSERMTIEQEYLKDSSINYSEPKRVEIYTESDSEIRCSWDSKYPCVFQGSGKLVEGGGVYSEGFSKCTAFVIKNPETNLGGLFHISDIDFQVPHLLLLRDFFLKWLETTKVDKDEKSLISNAIISVCEYDSPKSLSRYDLALKLKSLGVESVQTKLFSGDHGKYNNDSRLRDSLLTHLGVKLEPTIFFQDYKRWWSILVDLDKNLAKVNIPFKKEILEYEF